MVWTVSRYLSRLFLMRFGFLMLGLALLVVFGPAYGSRQHN